MGAVGPQANDQTGAAGPLPAELVLGATPVLKEPRLLGGHRFWLEQLPAQRGRTTLRMRSPDGMELELTPGLDLRSRIHGYGGGVYSVAAGAWADAPAAAGSLACRSRSNNPEADAIDTVHPPMEDAPQGARPAGRAQAGQTLVVVAEGGSSLWRLDLSGDPAAEPPAAPVRLTTAEPSAAGDHEPALFGDGLIDLARRRWIGVCDHGGRDRLVTVPLDGGTPQLLWDSPDFCGYAVLSPSGSHLAWLSWRQPCMPWERSQLWLGRFDTQGDLVEARVIAGSAPDDAEAISVFQPLWAGPDLVVANDRSGWWNLERLDHAEALLPSDAPAWRPLLPMQAEFAMPQWVYGMRTTAWDGRQLLAAACCDGRWQLGALLPAGEATQPSPVGPRQEVGDAAGSDVAGTRSGAAAAASGSASGDVISPAAQGTADGAPAALPNSDSAGTSASAARPATLRWQPIPLPFDDLAGLDAENGTLVAIASGPVDGPGLLELTLLDPTTLELGSQAQARSHPEASGCRWSHHPAAATPLGPEQISVPEALWFVGHGGLRSHAWYYPPQRGASPRAPLLVRGHSGPTAMARTGLSLAIQYWTSRGWGVVDVNYGGSTGFGRAYRERLDGGWGVVDVDDCLAAARAVVEAGRADPARIAMEGSSASGFTVLAAMARGDTLRAGAIRYPVTDLTSLAEGDHRFEARYFDALVGPWPEARALYEQRSPLNQVERIAAPLLFFHGLDDTVVPAQQSIAMVERLQQRGVPVELVLFEGEGHGFRDASVQRQVLERSEAFFRAQFQLPEPS